MLANAAFFIGVIDHNKLPVLNILATRRMHGQF